MDQLPDEYEALRKDVIEAARRLGLPLASNSGNQLTVTGRLQADSWGVWIASLCAVFVAGLAIMGGWWAASDRQQTQAQIAELRSQMSDMEDYLAAIYMQAPQLRPQEAEGDRRKVN